MDQEIQYSIIIPHKNIPELLQRCLDSIPRREDVQIIVVDDNSDTDKVDFGHFPGLGDPCVEIVFTKEGKGAGYARNVGLTKAVGKWLLFADADDYFIGGFLNCLDKYKESNYDLIYFGVYIIYAKTKRESYINRRFGKLMKDAINKKKYDKYKYTIIVPWGKMIKRSLIKVNNIFFDEIMVSNDVMFSVKTANCAKNVLFDIHKIYTYELLRYDSLTSNWTLEIVFIRLCVYINLNVFLIKNGQKKYKQELISLLLRLISIRDMTYFYKGIEIIKENRINIFFEFLEFGLLLPYRMIRRIRERYNAGLYEILNDKV
jgi:glycosyltransferase involved in cell wall biosynthesis